MEDAVLSQARKLERANWEGFDRTANAIWIASASEKSRFGRQQELP